MLLLLSRFLGAFLCLVLMAFQEAGETFKSGIPEGKLLPSSFAPYNINSEKKENDRYHCLVCEYGLGPVVMVFAREPAEGKDEALTDLLKKLDDLLSRHQKEQMNGFVVFLSPAARSSITDPKEEDPAKLVDEAAAREKLSESLRERAKKLKFLVVSCYPAEGPKGYQINPKALVTAIYYHRLKVVINAPFKEGELGAKNVEAFVKKVDDALASIKTKPVPKKKK